MTLERTTQGKLSRILIPALIVCTIAIPLATATPNHVVYDPTTQTWTVSPTGGDDTANLQAALDAAAAAGPGSTVQLTAGHFYCTNIIVKDFYGTFTGAGQDRTTIDTLQALDPTAPPIMTVYSEDIGTGKEFPTLFVFIRGDITISHLTFDITPAAPAEPWWVGGWYTVLYATVVVTGDTANSKCDNVRFKGHQGSEEWLGTTWNNHAGVFVDNGWYREEGARSAPISGTHSVVNCQFEHVEHGAWCAGLSNGTFQVGGSPTTGNTFNDMATAMGAEDMDNSDVEFSYNELHNLRMIGIVADAYEKPQSTPFPIHYISEPSRYLISHNTIHCIQPADGIGLIDANFLASGQKSIDARISHNDIILDTDYGGIFGIGAQDVVVLANHMRGNAIAGIYFGFSYDPCSNWLLLGNNVEHVNAWLAPIWLGPGTSACTVIGGPSKTNVYDEGTDNTLVGVNNMRGNPPGPAIRNALALKLALLHHFP